ncbi:MAG TPA: thioredoxin domain-containing protein [Polyangia bacterium]
MRRFRSAVIVALGLGLGCLAGLAASGIARAAELHSGAPGEVVHAPPGHQPERGSPDAAVTIDLYVAFGHPDSARIAELAAQAMGAGVRELVHLTGDGPPGAERVAEAALEAEAEGRFWPFFDRAVKPPFSAELAALDRMGKDAGLDRARLDEALRLGRHREAIAALGRRMRAGGHFPGELRVNGTRVFSPSRAALAAAIVTARARAQLLTSAGVSPSQIYSRLAPDPDSAPEPELSRLPRRRISESAAATAGVNGAPARGAPLSRVTVVIFSNFACAACAELESDLERVRAAHPGALREVWRQWAPPYGPSSLEGRAAEFAVAAARQGRFWELHDRIAATAGGRVTTLGELDALARSAGLDLGRAARERRLGLSAAVVGRDQRDARRLGLGFSPGVVVDGIPLSAPLRPGLLDALIASELELGALPSLGLTASPAGSSAEADDR